MEKCETVDFPDWLLEKQIPLRCDDPAYLTLARRYWEALYQQVKGQMYEDGGPVIGIQIENEYGHVGGQTGEAGEQHMRTLQKMAKEIWLFACHCIQRPAGAVR